MTIEIDYGSQVENDKNRKRIINRLKSLAGFEYRVYPAGIQVFADNFDALSRRVEKLKYSEC